MSHLSAEADAWIPPSSVETDMKDVCKHADLLLTCFSFEKIHLFLIKVGYFYEHIMGLLLLVLSELINIFTCFRLSFQHGTFSIYTTHVNKSCLESSVIFREVNVLQWAKGWKKCGIPTHGALRHSEGTDYRNMHVHRSQGHCAEWGESQFIQHVYDIPTVIKSLKTYPWSPGAEVAESMIIKR